MTLKKQKKLKYIPFIQLIPLFYWDIYCRKNNLKFSDWLKPNLKMVAFLFAIYIPIMILHFVFKSDLLDTVLFYLTIYPCFLGLATLSISAQEHHEKELIKQNQNN